MRQKRASEGGRVAADRRAAVWNKHHLTPDAVAAAAERVLVDVVSEDEPVDAIRLLWAVTQVNTRYAKKTRLDALNRWSIAVVRPQSMRLGLRATAEQRQAPLLDPVGLPEFPDGDLRSHRAGIMRPHAPCEPPSHDQRQDRDNQQPAPTHAGSLHARRGRDGRSSLDRDIGTYDPSSAGAPHSLM